MDDSTLSCIELRHNWLNFLKKLKKLLFQFGEQQIWMYKK